MGLERETPRQVWWQVVYGPGKGIRRGAVKEGEEGQVKTKEGVREVTRSGHKES